jgi:hypothetical protein
LPTRENWRNIYDLSSRWNIEVEAKSSFWNFWGSKKYDIIPHGENTGLLHTHNEAPNFSWRRQFTPIGRRMGPCD